MQRLHSQWTTIGRALTQIHATQVFDADAAFEDLSMGRVAARLLGPHGEELNAMVDAGSALMKCIVGWHDCSSSNDIAVK